MWERGTRVRCVDDNWDLRRQPSLREVSFPKLGLVYTVRDTEMTEVGEHCVRFLEIQNPVLRYDVGGSREPGFSLSRFEEVHPWT